MKSIGFNQTSRYKAATRSPKAGDICGGSNKIIFNTFKARGGLRQGFYSFMDERRKPETCEVTSSTYKGTRLKDK
jgi:hypothetical protein